MKGSKNECSHKNGTKGETVNVWENDVFLLIFVELKLNFIKFDKKVDKREVKRYELWNIESKIGFA